MFVFLWIQQTWEIDFYKENAKDLLRNFISCIPSSFGVGIENEMLDLKFKKVFVNIAALFENFVNFVTYNASRMPTVNSPDENGEKLKLVEFSDVNEGDFANALLDRDHYQMAAVKPLQFIVRLWNDESDPVISRYIADINNLITSFNTVLLSNYRLLTGLLLKFVHSLS
jgi:hypothetical protein